MSGRDDMRQPRQFVTSDDVRSAAARNESHIVLPQNCTVTDEARELALKFSIRLDDAGAARPGPVAASPAPRPKDAPPPAADQPTSLPEDTNRRVVEAVTQVLDGLNLGERKAALLPTIVRRVFAGLAANRS